MLSCIMQTILNSNRRLPAVLSPIEALVDLQKTSNVFRFDAGRGQWGGIEDVCPGTLTFTSPIWSLRVKGMSDS